MKVEGQQDNQEREEWSDRNSDTRGVALALGNRGILSPSLGPPLSHSCNRGSFRFPQFSFLFCHFMYILLLGLIPCTRCTSESSPALIDMFHIRLLCGDLLPPLHRATILPPPDSLPGALPSLLLPLVPLLVPARTLASASTPCSGPCGPLLWGLLRPGLL